MAEILSVRNLKKTFKLSAKQQKLEKSTSGLKTAVDGISFDAHEGEIFGLLGPNGAGKTTTLRMIATLIRPDSGDIFVKGFSAVKEPEKVRAEIGFLTSELKLEDFFTPNYLFDFFSELRGIPANIREKRKAELFGRFGINEFAEVKVANLSTGMKQKASLAISLAHDPDIIIFDEPTNGLDVITSKLVTECLLDLRKEVKTLIISTHIFSLVEKLCDRVGIIINGRMTVCDTLENVCDGKNIEDRFFEIYAREGGTLS